jgi:hypothetical protein
LLQAGRVTLASLCEFDGRFVNEKREAGVGAQVQ